MTFSQKQASYFAIFAKESDDGRYRFLEHPLNANTF